MKLEEIIEEVKKQNPYPIDLFPLPEDNHYQNVGKFLKDNGFSPDRIFAQFGRMVYDNCVSKFTEYLEEYPQSESIIEQMDIDLEDSGVPQGEIVSLLNHWKNKYLIIEK